MPFKMMPQREKEQVVSNAASKSQLEIYLESELANLGIRIKRSMYKVPQILHDANKEAYTPKLISIGPYHYTNKNLYATYSLKLRILRSFLERTGLELGTYVQMAQGWEERVRQYYYHDEGCGLNSDELVHMILMDSIFIVEYTWLWYNDLNQGSGARIMPSHLDISLKDDIMRDLTLLENQLPFFVLKELGDHSFPPGNNNINHGWIFYLSTLFIHHFHLIPTSDSNRSRLRVVNRLGTYGIGHLVDFIHIILTDRGSMGNHVSYGEPKLEHSRSATELQEAGVKLGCALDLMLTHITFTENGVLQIPRLVVNRNTESLFRNIIAYEQCRREGNVFRSYVILMDCLINTSQDVELLVDLGIIENSLGTSEDVCTLFNNLYKMPMMERNIFHYDELCQRLNEYSRDPWHKWKATWFRWKLILRRDYFSSPWSLFSVIAAFILLSLTIIQTICSIKGVKW